ncbi:ArnT family glycosyltransferase [Tuwongella immobilis]|uniref:Glycosyltransferase RgtA/B/C/D-like domain-containing protein n=1 Tax=Tuwongella immobilis TaxID=692036 RepID=A0A6C2YJ17_9BACT|nr:glycosyltransferase family 39 protein [Tuwongella immobilis]VIP01406.1 Uncharacterized protein OS=Thioflavicoccus mobilis 8321 GN=Thimo_0856 PE=4 SV=1: PMT_2 [Tuwongella immobilis]VTR98310.1 Uncharacterized protein OS=Thioflavicoccus mobilis 8321 GN=Thimo_0856 PE=4 SV=1: PMT_2 [Tuwongella immobilis]
MTRRLWLILAVVLAAHGLIRLAIGPALESDDADLAVFTQSWEWGFSEQPPLFSWIVGLMTPIFGVNLATLTLVRMLMLAGMLLAIGRLARVLAPQQSDAPARLILALMLIPNFSWHALIFLTHSILAVTFSILILKQVLHLRQNRSWGGYLILGLLVGLGGLSKYTVLPVVLAAMLASLGDAASRRALIDRRMLLAILLAGGIITPHLLWLREHWESVWSTLSGKAMHSSQWNLLAVLRGCGHFVLQWLLILLPMGGLLAMAFRDGRWRGIWRPATEVDAWMLRVLAAGAVIFGLQIVILGADKLHERWYQPFVVMLPMVVIARISPSAWTAIRERRYRQTMLVMFGLLTIARLSQVAIGDTLPGSAPKRFPIRADYRPVALELSREQAIEFPTAGLILASERQIAGNLRVQLPMWWVACRSHLVYTPPLPDDWQLLPLIAVWRADEGESMPKTLRLLGGAKLDSVLHPIGPIHAIDAGSEAAPVPLRWVRLQARWRDDSPMID